MKKSNLGKYGNDYYDAGGLSVMDVIKAKLGAEASFTGFKMTTVIAGFAFNIIKYALRWMFKGTPRRDLEKLRDYAQEALDCLEEQGV